MRANDTFYDSVQPWSPNNALGDQNVYAITKAKEGKKGELQQRRIFPKERLLVTLL